MPTTMSKPTQERSPPHTRAGKQYSSTVPTFTPPREPADAAAEEERLLLAATMKAEAGGGGAGSGPGAGAGNQADHIAPGVAAVGDARAQAAKMRAEMRAKRAKRKATASAPHAPHTPPKSHLVKTPFGPMDPVAWDSMQQMRNELRQAQTTNVKMAQQHAAMKRNFRTVCMERDRSVKQQKAMQQKLQAARVRDATRTQLDDRKYYAPIDNKGFKAIYAQFGVNGRRDDGSAPLFAQVHVRHFRGENREIYGDGCCMNADQFFNMVTHIPNLVEVLEKDMGVQVPAHIRPVLTLLNGNGAGSATS